MREALFIKKNKDKWKKLVDFREKPADEIADEFIELLNDLSFAKTFYPHSKITGWLNHNAAIRYLKIYQNRKDGRNPLLYFFRFYLPLTIARHYVIISGCFFIFILFFFTGFISAKNDPQFVVNMLGHDYVEFTKKNIEAGNPFAVYGNSNSFFMWLGIMINNLSVAFRFFSEGIFFGIFTLRDLVFEAVRIGAFEQMFFQYGLGKQSILTVFIHGTLELFAIILAAASGIILGTGWLFPGTGTRLQALKNGAKDGVTIICGLIPIFVLAAFFEGYITRHAALHWSIGVTMLTLSLLLIIGYFIVYPILLKIKMKKRNAL